jgi:ketosteroid isomerase-like protein
MGDSLQDAFEIMTALSRLSGAFDRRDWPAVEALMSDDVVAYGQSGVRAVIDDSLRRHLGGCGPTQHLLGNHDVHVDGDTARSVTQARVFHQGAGTRAELWWECLGEYRDTWLRTGAGWRITTRTFEVRIARGDIEVLQPG